MAKGFNLVAEPRDDAGKGASRRLRRSGKVPAIIYGAGEAPQNITLDHNALLRHLEHEAFLSSVLTVRLNGSEQPAIVKDIHAHPAKRQVLHMDLQRIVADQEIRMEVPIHFRNEDKAVGVKLRGGTVSHMMTEVEIVCLPKDLPEYLELDIGELDLDETLYLSDVPLPEGVEIPELAQGPENDRGVVSIHIIKVVEEPEEAEAEGVEGEEGAEPAEGEAAEEGETDKEEGAD